MSQAKTLIGLNRDYCSESLRITSVKAAHAADNILLTDDAGAERDINFAVTYLQRLVKDVPARQSGGAG